MKTATQLFPSSYLQPNNIDWIVGILQKKNFGKIYDFMFVLFIIIHFPYRKKSSSGNFCGVWAFRLQWEFYFFSEMLFEKKNEERKKNSFQTVFCVYIMHSIGENYVEQNFLLLTILCAWIFRMRLHSGWRSPYCFSSNA